MSTLKQVLLAALCENADDRATWSTLWDHLEETDGWDRRTCLMLICAQPGTSEPRLKMADWLARNRQGPFARFIRLQHQLWSGWPEVLAALKGRPWGYPPHVNHLLVEQRRLLTHSRFRAWYGRHLPNWCLEPPTAIREAAVDLSCGHYLPARQTWRWRLVLSRGFPAALACPGADWLAWGDYLLYGNPLQRVLLTSPLPCKVTDLPLSGGGISRTWEWTVGSKTWRQKHSWASAEECRTDWFYSQVRADDELLKHLWPGVRFERP